VKSLHRVNFVSDFIKPISLLMAFVAFVAGALQLSAERVDVVQPHSDAVSPLITYGHAVGQVFRSARPGLDSIEVRAVVNSSPGDGLAGHHLIFHLKNAFGDKAELATVRLEASGITNNQLLRFTFEPQRDSEGKTYYFFLEADTSGTVSVWLSTVSMPGLGSLLIDRRLMTGALQFTAYYRYDVSTTLNDLFSVLPGSASVMLSVLLVLFAPGLMLWCGMRVTWRYAVSLLGMWFGLSLTIVPIAFAWAGVLGVSLSASRIYAVLGCIAIVLLASHRPHTVQRQRISIADVWSNAALVLVLMTILFLRYADAADLIVPSWVDSVHHTAIAELMVENGSIPNSYQPYADVSPFYYHFGFHAMVALFSWLSGMRIEWATLAMGQALNLLASASVYVLASEWLRSRSAGLVALLITGIVSIMPAYYVSWGRYTQLAGLVVLPIALLAFMRSMHSDSRAKQLVAAILIGGIALLHYRVALFMATFMLAYFIWRVLARLHHRQSALIVCKRILVLAVMSVVIIAPWLWHILNSIIWTLLQHPDLASGTDVYNTVPWTLVWGQHNSIIIQLALLGIVLGIRRHRAQVGVLVLWIVITAVVINLSLLGIKPTWIVTNESMVISMYLPLSLLVAIAVASINDILRTRVSLNNVRLVWWLVLPILIVTVAMAARDQFALNNPETILVLSDDLPAMEWIRQNLSVDALILVNDRFWQGQTYVGTDGGYWIPNLTGRRTTMPIAFYTNGDQGYWQHVNDLAIRIDAGPDPTDKTFLEALRQRGVTHVYIGAKGGPLPLAKFIQSEHYGEIYGQGTVHIFEVRY
jgi:hypothetical protein